MRSRSIRRIGFGFLIGAGLLAVAADERGTNRGTIGTAGNEASSERSPHRIDPSLPWEHEDGRIQHRGRLFDSWSAWREANPRHDHRCGAGAPASAGGSDGLAGTGDCGLASTNPTEEYDPSNGSLVIPVVVHVIMNDSETLGDIGRETIERQINILNDDFSGRGVGSDPSTPASGIRFVLARIDSTGAPTTGITRSSNSTWFNDQGEYWNELAWDPNRFINIYVNNGGGVLGYVNAFPAAGSAGAVDDRIVIDWRVFGEAGSYGAPQDLGRILTHEVGHYFGLFHTFQGGCGTADCLATGDLICDTAPHSEPNVECSSIDTCGFESPVSNFMNYSWQACMSGFTSQQVRRMRCTIETYRPELAMESEACGYECEHDLNGDGFVDGGDLGIMLGQMSGIPSEIVQCGDFNLDGMITGSDLGSLLGAWGECTVPACPSGPVCDDGDDCTVDYCLDGECRHLELLDCGVCGLPDAGSCYESNGSPGCSEGDCCEAICDVDPYCCLIAWDGSCRTKALSGNFPECDG